MRIASFVGQKGGVGKSTLARVLTVTAASQEYKVLQRNPRTGGAPFRKGFLLVNSTPIELTVGRTAPGV